MFAPRPPSDEPTSGDGLARGPRPGRLLCRGAAGRGAIGLVGWLAGAPALTTIVPGQPPMMPNTALGLMLVGVAGALRPREGRGGVQRTLSLVAALAAVALGAGTLVEYVFGVEFRIDQILVPAPGPEENHPGRPSPPTALALALLGAALLIFDSRPKARAR